MRVGIIGAGITGLALTHQLAEQGVDVLTFEADTEPGGVIRSASIDGRVLEYGPQRLRLTPELRTLVEATDLADELIVADPDLPLYVYRDGALRAVPKSLSAFLKTDALSWRGKARLLWEPFTDPIDPTERVSAAFIRKFGTEAYHALLEPLFGGMYGSDPSTMPADPALDRLIALESAHGSVLRAALQRMRSSGDTPPPASFRAGLQALPHALYDRHDAIVHLDTPVTAVRAAAAEDGFEIDAGDRTTAVDHVVVTTPAAATARILSPVLGDDSSVLAGLRYNSLALVHLAAPTHRTGFGYQVARRAGLHTLGVTWNASLFGRDGIHTAFFGGMWDPDVFDRDDDELGRLACEEFETVMGISPAVVDVTRLPGVMPAFDDSWTDLPDLDLPEGLTLASSFAGHVGIPSRVRDARAIADRLVEQAE